MPKCHSSTDIKKNYVNFFMKKKKFLIKSFNPKKTGRGAIVAPPRLFLQKFLTREDLAYKTQSEKLLTIQGGPERMQHLRSLISKKPWTKSN